jgi:excisionase family DNA binding protein
MNPQPQPGHDRDQRDRDQRDRDPRDRDANQLGSVGEFFTLGELAELLRIPAATLRYWRHCETGPDSYKVGRHIRYDRRDVDAWLRRQRHPSGPDGA